MRTPKVTHAFIALLFISGSVLLSGCTKSSSGSDSGSGGSGGGGGSSQEDFTGNGTTFCGVITNGEVQNPVDLGDGESVTLVQAVSNNLAIVSNGSGQKLVKLQGVANAISPFYNKASADRMTQLASGGAVFFKATEACDTVISGSNASIGSLLTRDGKSIGEILLKEGLSPADPNDACNGSLIGSCLTALANETDEQILGEVGSGFLWKPASDKDGNLVVHVQECDAVVLVNGQPLQDAGAGNGRCTTARASYPGCAAGSAARVQVVDKFSGLPYSFNGKPQLILNGCQRFEIP